MLTKQQFITFVAKFLFVIILLWLLLPVVYGATLLIFVHYQSASQPEWTEAAKHFIDLFKKSPNPLDFELAGLISLFLSGFVMVRHLTEKFGMYHLITAIILILVTLSELVLCFVLSDKIENLSRNVLGGNCHIWALAELLERNLLSSVVFVALILGFKMPDLTVQSTSH